MKKEANKKEEDRKNRKSLKKINMKQIEVTYENGWATINDKKECVIIVLNKEQIEALLEKVCVDCNWVIS